VRLRSQFRAKHPAIGNGRQLRGVSDRAWNMTELRDARRTLDPRVDLVFNLLFGSEQNRGLLIALLNDVLQPATPIESVEILPAGPEAGTVEDKCLDKLSADPETLERVERREIELKLHEYGAALMREQGRSEGRSEGKRQTLLRLLAIKFGELPPEPVSRIATASEADLDLWLERLLSANALDSVFAR